MDTVTKRAIKPTKKKKDYLTNLSLKDRTEKISVAETASDHTVVD